MNSTTVTSLKGGDSKNGCDTLLIKLSSFQSSGQGKIKKKEGWGEKLDTRWPLKVKEWAELSKHGLNPHSGCASMKSPGWTYFSYLVKV